MEWAPINLAAKRFFPRHGERPYTHIEALFSVQADHWHRQSASIRGYAALWAWDRRRVATFLREIGVEIVGQSGSGYGQLQPCATNAPQIFMDFGHIDDPRDENCTTKKDMRHKCTTNCTTNRTTNAPQVDSDSGELSNSDTKKCTTNCTTTGTENAPYYTYDNKTNTHTPPAPPEGEETPVGGWGCDETYLFEIARKLMAIERAKKAQSGGKIENEFAYLRGITAKMRANGGPTPEDMDAAERWEEQQLQASRKKEHEAEQQRAQADEERREKERSAKVTATFQSLSADEKARKIKQFIDSQAPNLRPLINLENPIWLISFMKWLGEHLEVAA